MSPNTSTAEKQEIIERIANAKADPRATGEQIRRVHNRAHVVASLAEGVKKAAALKGVKG